MCQLTHVEADVFNPFRPPYVEFVVPLSQQWLRWEVKWCWKTLEQEGKNHNSQENFLVKPDANY